MLRIRHPDGEFPFRKLVTVEETQLGERLITMHLLFPNRVPLLPSTGQNEQRRGLYYCRGQAAPSWTGANDLRRGFRAGVSPLLPSRRVGSPANALLHTLLVVEAQPQGIFDIVIA